MTMNKCFAVLVAVAMMAVSARAEMIVSDDFEDSSLDGWLSSTTGGGGSFTVEAHNSSNMARVSHSSSGEHALSRTVDYNPNDRVMFDMHAVANSAFGAVGGTKHAGSGVRVSFLNSFNVVLGSAGLYNVTSNSYLGANDSAIGNTQLSFDNAMSEYAALAGLDSDPSVAKMTFSFLAWGEFWFGGNIYPNITSSANVWFDNFKVTSQAGAIPEPAAAALLSLGLIGFGVRRRRA